MEAKRGRLRTCPTGPNCRVEQSASTVSSPSPSRKRAGPVLRRSAISAIPGPLPTSSPCLVAASRRPWPQWRRTAAALYPKADPTTGWVGPCEIASDAGFVYVIERDDQIGSSAAVKMIHRIPVGDVVPAELREPLPVVSKE